MEIQALSEQPREKRGSLDVKIRVGLTVILSAAKENVLSAFGIRIWHLESMAKTCTHSSPCTLGWEGFCQMDSTSNSLTHSKTLNASGLDQEGLM